VKPAQVARLPQQAIKVLRIGVLQGGKIIQERRIDIKETVTVGDNPKATFQLTVPKLPKKFPVFLWKGDGYHLQFVESMSGKVALDNEVLGLDELRKKGKARRKGDVWSYPLQEQNRGKITIEGYTLLFQFVPAPPEPLHPAIQTDFRAKLLEEDDPVFLAFLGLFSVLATIFVVYVRSVEPVEIVDLASLPQRLVEIAIPKELLDKKEQGAAEKAATEDKKEDPKKREEVASEDKTPRKQLTAEEKAAAEIVRKQRLEAEVLQKSLLLKMIGTRGEGRSGDKAQDLFTETDGVGQNLDAALKVVSGAEVGTASSLAIKQGLGEGTGRGDASIGDLAKADGGTSKLGSGPGTKVRTKVVTEGADISGEGDPGKVKGIVNGNIGQIQACYEAQLKADPTLKGRVEVQWNIVNGRVTSAKVFANSTGNAALANCIVDRVRRWTFPKEIEMDVLYPFVLSSS
jgi:hypothetical protein